MRAALVVGGNGQDGTFLCRRLLDAGYRVISIGRQPTPRVAFDSPHFQYRSLDLARDATPLRELLMAERPERVFHVAAVHASAQANAYEPLFCDMLSVNVATVHTIIEHLRAEQPLARFVYASSAKVFGAPLPAVIDESTLRDSPCLYSITKNAAGDLIRYYRKTHDTACSQLFLFNHESELRPAGFFIPKLVRALGQAVQGIATQEIFETLDFFCDWGSADEFMGLMIEAAEKAPREDFVVATGRTIHARDLAQRIFTSRGLSLAHHVKEVSARPGQPSYRVETAKLQHLLGRTPTMSIEAIIDAWRAPGT